MGNVRVLYIAGLDRSGSTILGRVLGQASGCAFVGETARLLEGGGMLRGKRTHQCGCGELLSECPFWSEVKATYRRNTEREEPGFFDFSHRTRDLLFERRPPRQTDESGLHEFYEAIEHVSGANVIVDSSKHPSYLYSLSRDENIDLRVLHVVRDPRAVANSEWNRPLDDKDKNVSLWNASKAHFRMHNPVRCALEWMEWNYIIRGLWGGQQEGRYHLLRYEDFCKAPQATLKEAERTLGCDLNPTWETKKALHLRKQHSAAGNPHRFSEGATGIRLSEKWKTEASLPMQLGVGLLASPLLGQFGYKLR